MPRNEDGEMELVLGNKQLLSVLFILVVLLGVFFTMGYIVGRNNPSDEKVRLAVAKQQVASAVKQPPIAIDPGSGAVTTKPTPAPIETAPATGPVTVEPKKEAEKKAEPKPDPKKEEPKQKEETKKAPEPPKQPEPAKPAPVEVAGGLFQQTPAPGRYLQVAAIDRPGASGMAEAYRKQGFPAIITPSSSPTLFRVVIGPLKDDAAVADVKTRLKKIGVDGAIPRKF